MIRSATTNDREFITKLAHVFDRFGRQYVQVFATMVDRYLAADQAVAGEVVLFFIHEDDAGERTGFVAVEWGQGVGHIHGVAVEARFRRTGVATQLVEHVKQLASHRGTQALECITAETDNAPALGCFTQCGFDNMGREGAYPNHQLAVRLRHDLTHAN